MRWIAMYTFVVSMFACGGPGAPATPDAGQDAGSDAATCQAGDPRCDPDCPQYGPTYCLVGDPCNVTGVKCGVCTIEDKVCHYPDADLTCYSGNWEPTNIGGSVCVRDM